MTMIIGDKCVVAIHYKLTNDSGEQLDASQDEPLVYLHGAAGIIPGLENELTGKAAGAEFNVTIKPEEAYGERVEEMIQTVPLAQFPEPDKLEIGTQLTGQNEMGQFMAVVTAIDTAAGSFTIDANHPLAGMTLHFEGKVESVREATEEELSHGHAH